MRTEVPVPAGETVLEAILDAGLDVPHPCESGVRGTCRTRLEGPADMPPREALTAAEAQA